MWPRIKHDSRTKRVIDGKLEEYQGHVWNLFTQIIDVKQSGIYQELKTAKENN